MHNNILCTVVVCPLRIGIYNCKNRNKLYTLEITEIC